MLLLIKVKTGLSFQKGLPSVAIHDLVIQPSAKHLILGTHGRSLYKASIAPLQLMTSRGHGKRNAYFSNFND